MQVKTHVYASGGGWTPALDAAMDSRRTLVLAFGASQFATDSTPLNELVAAFPQSHVVGCSTAGEIAGTSVQDSTVSVAVARFEHCSVQVAVAEVDSAAASYAAGEALARQLPPEGLRAVFVLSDGMHVNGTPLVEALSRGLPAGVSISGGLAGDGSRFVSTWVLADGQIRTRCVAAVGLYGSRLRIGTGCEGGWNDFGPLRRITRSEGNVLWELDGKPALDLYKTYLGDLAAGLPGSALLFPLSIRRPGQAGTALVRTILSIDEQNRSMTFAGDMPQGYEARLMRCSDEKLIDSASEAIHMAVRNLPAQGPVLLISVSCVGRRLMLGERTEEEIEGVVSSRSGELTHVGFYSYGEISASARDLQCELHNQTMTVTAIAEV